mmetsp:Transcript_4130/g.3455  ORF Transcript_4130/g.3455 Transcript_4130/m.3455 type:complete len:286 (+) Transcript_4130:2-859(+)
MKKRKYFAIIGGTLTAIGVSIFLYKYLNNEEKKEETIEDIIQKSKPEQKEISKADIISILNKGLADYQLTIATWYKVSLKMSTDNADTFEDTIRNKIKQGIDTINSKFAKELGYELKTFKSDLEKYKNDAQIYPLIAGIEVNINRVVNRKQPEFKLEEDSSVDPKTYMEFFELSNQQFLWALYQKYHLIEKKTAAKIQELIRSNSSNKYKTEVWEVMDLPKSKNMDVLSYTKLLQAIIVVNHPQESDRITQIQANARKTLQNIIKGTKLPELEKEPLAKYKNSKM